MASPADSSDLYKSQIRNIAGQTSNSPIWRTIPVQNWTTGDVIAFDLATYVISPDGSPITIAELGDNLPSALTLVSGVITGTISSIQGGTYEIVVTATNSTGTPISNILPAIVVSLEITAPVWSTTNPVPDFNTQEVGGAFNLNLNDYIDDDGDPANISALTFSYSASNGFPAGVDFTTADAFAGLLVGITTAELTLTTITATATNESQLSSDEAFDMTVIATAGTSEQGFIAGWYSGQLSCGAAVAPTWGTPTNFSVDEGEVVSINILTNIASDGGADITAMTLGGTSDALPLALDITTTMGSVVGTVTAGEAGTYDLTFIATNSVGDSLESGIFTMTVADPAVVIPTLDRIDAVDGSSSVFFNYSETITTTSNFTDGIVFKVNGVTKSLLILGNAGDSRVEYSVPGVTFSGNNTLNAVLTDSLCGIVSYTTGNEVADADVSFVVAVPPTVGVIFTDGFESGDLVGNSGTGSWYSPTSNCTVQTTNPKTGNYSLEFYYNGSNPGSVNSEIRFYLGALYNEVWIKYDLYIPSNYYHPPQSDGASNHKFTYIWGDANDNYSAFPVTPGISTQLWSTNIPGESKITAKAIGADVGTIYYPPSNTLIKTSDFGTWINIILHVKQATQLNNDGVIQVWKTLADGSRNQITNVTDGDFYQASQKGFNRGYLMGAAASSFYTDTVFYIDNIVFSTESLL